MQRQLAEQLLTIAAPNQNTTLVYLRRLEPQKQFRLEKLMDKHSEGQLSRMERMELQRLDSEIDEVLIANSQALARTLRPELFNEHGKPPKQRFRHAVREPSLRYTLPQQENLRG